MGRRDLWAVGCALLLAFGCGAGTSGTGAQSPVPDPVVLRAQTITVGGSVREVQVPEGMVLEFLAGGMDRPRFFAFDPAGMLLVGSKGGTVYRVAPPYSRADPLVRTGGYPHSVAVRPGELLIAKTEGLYAAPYKPGQESLDPATLRLLAALPSGRGHSSRTVAVGLDGRIYLSLGISGNCSDEYLDPSYPFDRRRGGVLVLREGDGGAEWEPFASGLRNPVGFDWHPATGRLYATNNGPDHWGFEQPPENFRALPPGSFHGMPWFQWDGTALKRDTCIDTPPPRPAGDVAPPDATFPARNAPLGMAFVGPGALRPEFEGDAVVALHGSWATRPSGGFFGDPATRRPPALVLVRFEGGKPVRVDELVTGFQLPSGERWARPAGVAVGPDGHLYFTSDEGVQGIFRLRAVAGGAP